MPLGSRVRDLGVRLWPAVLGLLLMLVLTETIGPWLVAAGAIAAGVGGWLVGVATIDETGAVAPAGSPVIDGDGEVVGITAATNADEPAAVTPIDVARSVAEEILAHGEPRHPWLGVTATEHGADAPDGGPDAEATGPPGARVTSVDPGGRPA